MVKPAEWALAATAVALAFVPASAGWAQEPQADRKSVV